MPQYRQLAAIMFTDIVGYTALMGEDEQNAFTILAANRQMQRPIIEQYGGKWIKELGDGVMATFSTVTDAVTSAILIQQSCKKVDGLQLRIGIHLSEVVFESNDVFGDGVNIAARIQAIAPPAGIWISDAVQRNISNKRGIETRFVGEEKLKNVKDPIQIFEVNTEVAQATEASILSKPHKEEYKISKKSIAVLPLANISGDPDQEYFSDGIAEEILNSLSQLRDLKVVGRSSSFQFKGQNISLPAIGEKLGVATILEGSIRKQGNRVRITTQLTNASDGVQLWSERYDREMDDIFAIQDEIALAITEKLKVTLWDDERALINQPVVNTQAYEVYLKGRYYWNKRGRWLSIALQFFEEAIKIDPKLARAHAGLADTYAALGLYGILSPRDAMPKAKQAAMQSIELDPLLCEAYTSMGFICGMYENDRYAANQNFKHALQLNPEYAIGHSWYSFYLTVVEMYFTKSEEEGTRSTDLEPNNSIAYHITGLAFLAERRFDDAIQQAFKAIELDATLFLPYFLLGWCYIEKGDLLKAVEYLNSALNLSQRHSWPLGFMALAQSMLGNKKAAHEIVDEIIKRSKDEYFSVLGTVIGATAIGDINLALQFLEKGYEDRDILLPIFAHLTVMPEKLRTNKNFLEFVDRLTYSVKI